MKRFQRSCVTEDEASCPRFASDRSPEVALSRAEHESELVRRAHAGQGRALDVLFGRYRDRVVELARRRIGARLRMREDPEDLAQTTFREAVRDFGRYQYRGESSFLNWLTQILLNKIRDKAEFHAAAKRDVSRERADEIRSSGPGARPFQDPISPDPSATHIIQQNEESKILHEHLAGLSELPRTAIQLVYFEGLSLREAGERMGGRSEDAVRMILRRGALRLRDELERELGR